jgi:hypothetical protein
MPPASLNITEHYWYERKHAEIDLYIDGALRASLDYFAGSAVIFAYGGNDGLKIVAPWSADIFGIVEDELGVGRVTEIRYPPVKRSDWRILAEGRTKEVERFLYGPAGEFQYFIDAAWTNLNVHFSDGAPKDRKAAHKPRLRAVSAKAADALLRARRAAMEEQGQENAKALALLLNARRYLEGIPPGKVLTFEKNALPQIKMALAAAGAGKCLREPLGAQEATKLRNAIAGIEPPF